MNASGLKLAKKSAILLALCLVIQGGNAQAYFYPGGYGNFVPGLLSAVPYFGFSFMNRGPYSSYPLYTLQNSLYRQATRTLASPYNYNTNYMNYSNTMNYAMQDPSNYPYQPEQYSDPEPWYQPRQRTRPVRAGATGLDQNTHATWQNAAPPNNYLASMPAQSPAQGQVQAPSYFIDPLRTPISGEISNMPAPNAQDFGPITAPGQMPPLAPNVVSKRGRSNRHHKQNFGSGTPVAQPVPSNFSSPSNPVTPASTAGPLARGFVARVNQVYDGDIGRALFDPEMRGWARCPDLVKDDDVIKLDLSPTRIGLIQQVMKDSSLDDLSKLDAVKVLLRGGANRAN